MPRPALQSPSDFEACLAEPDEELVLECLQEAGNDAEACVESGAVCP